MLQASSDGFPSLSSEATVRVRGPPRILSGREVQHGNPGDTVNILCEATAVPRIQAFVWLFQVIFLHWKIFQLENILIAVYENILKVFDPPPCRATSWALGTSL